MKKGLIAAAIALAATFTAGAADSYSHDASVLPQAARETVKNNFKASISVIKIDKDFGRISDYEVVLTDGTEIKFDREGNWKDIETPVTKSVPKAFVPDAISRFVADKHAGLKIVGIEKERSGYEVQLSNDLDLKFDKAGNFKKYD